MEILEISLPAVDSTCPKGEELVAHFYDKPDMWVTSADASAKLSGYLFCIHEMSCLILTCTMICRC